MHAYTKLVKKFLNGYMAETREQRGMSKEEMSERLRIDPSKIEVVMPLAHN